MEGLRKISTDGFTQGVFDDNALAAEAGTLYQGGAGVLAGLALSAGSGLTLNVAGGVAQGIKAATVPGFSQAVPDGATSYVWLSFAKSGLDVSGNPVYAGLLSFTPTPAQPGGPLVCLGRVTAAGGAITSVTADGRMVLDRWTAERTFKVGDGAAFDAEAGALDLVGALTAGSLGQVSKAFGADVALTPTEARAFALIATGSPGAARNLVVPAVPGKPYAVVNRTDSTLTVKTAAGTGVAVASGKSALVLCDGANVVRLTLDA